MIKKILLSFTFLTVCILFLAFSSDLSEETGFDYSADIFSELKRAKNRTPQWIQPYSDHLHQENYAVLVDSLRHLGNESIDKNFLLGHSYFQIEDYELAKVYLSKVTHPSFELTDYALYFLSRIYLQEKAYNTAIPFLYDLVYKYPESIWSEKCLINLAQSYYKTQNYTLSATYYREYNRRFPDGEYQYLSRKGYVDCLEMLGVKNESEKLSKELWLEFPQYYDGKAPSNLSDEERLQRIENLYEVGYYKSVIKTCDYVLRREPDSPVEDLVRLYKAKAMGQYTFYRSGRRWVTYRVRTRKQAIADLKNLIKKTKNQKIISESYYYIAKLYQWNLNYDEFETWAKAGLDSVPDGKFNDKILYELIEYYRDVGKYDLAFQYIETYKDSFPQSALMEEFLLQLGEGYYQQQLYWRAAKSFEKLVSITDDSELTARGLYWQGKSLEKNGEVDAAVEKFYKCTASYCSYYSYLSEKRLMRLGKSPTRKFDLISQKIDFSTSRLDSGKQMHYEKALKLIELGVYSLAEGEFRYLMRRNPDNPIMRSHLAWTYYERGEMIRCVNTLQKGVDQGMSYPPEVWQLFYPRIYYDKILEQGEGTDVDPLLVLSVIRQESVFNPEAKSWVGARGLMQIMPRTGWEISRILRTKSYHKNRLYEVDLNLEFGIWYLSSLLDRFDNDLELSLASYNGGMGNVMKWLETHSDLEIEQLVEIMPLDETRHYTKVVLRNYWVYQKLYRFGYLAS
jgi:soluble lytic murein transglycosylase